MANPPQTFPTTAIGTISVKDGKIVIEAEDGTENPLRVAAGGELKFRTKPGSKLKWWSILFVDQTPFDDASGWASGPHGAPRGKKIGKSAHGGGQAQKSYAYAVVASDGKEVYFRDPEVVVGPDSGP